MTHETIAVAALADNAEATSSPSAALAAAWKSELSIARAARAIRDDATEWAHLERAHILGQPSSFLHLRTHLAMLAAGFRRRDLREVAGQVMRLAVAGPGSLSGRYPVGNTGGSNVSALKPMPIPADLLPLLSNTSHTRHTSHANHIEDAS